MGLCISENDGFSRFQREKERNLDRVRFVFCLAVMELHKV